MPRNKQPLYHSATILFTATREFTPGELRDLLQHRLVDRDIDRKTIDVEFVQADPGDPADLV